MSVNKNERCDWDTTLTLTLTCVCVCVCVRVTEPTASPRTLPPPSRCDSGSSFICDDGTCVDASLHCDGHYDCVDGSDELNCGTYVMIAVSCGAVQCHVVPCNLHV